jgi:hypothetical protein
MQLGEIFVDGIVVARSREQQEEQSVIITLGITMCSA